MGGWLAPGSARVFGVMFVCYESRYLCIVLGGYLRILGAPSVQFCCILSISAS